MIKQPVRIGGKFLSLSLQTILLRLPIAQKVGIGFAHCSLSGWYAALDRTQPGRTGIADAARAFEVNVAAVQAALARLMQDRTTIIVAHRLSTVRDADRIVVIEGANVVEQGRHDELMARRGTYHRLVEHQLIADQKVAS